MRRFFRLFLVSVLCLPALPGPATAQNDITAQVAQIYSIPLVDGHMLVTDRPEHAQRFVPLARRTQDTAAQDLLKGWRLFEAYNRYRSIDPTFVDSLNFAGMVLDANTRLFFLQQIGGQIAGNYETAEAFRTYLGSRADEFHRHAFHEAFKKVYGADDPIFATLRVLNLKIIDFGGVNIADETLQISGLSGQGLGPDNFLATSMPDHIVRKSMTLRMDDKATFVRSLVGEDAALRGRAAYILVAGTLTVGPEGKVWRPTALAAYHDAELSRPIPQITYDDVYMTREAYEAEQLALQAAETARREAYRQQREREREEAAERQRQIDALRRAPIIAAVRAELANRTFDMLGVTFDMTEAQAREMLGTRFELSQTSSAFDSARPDPENPSCIAARNALRAQINSRRGVLQAGDDGLTPEQQQELAEFSATLIVQMKRDCRPNLSPFGISFDATRQLENGVSDRVTVFLGPAGSGPARVIAASRVLSWAKGEIDIPARLTAKFGPHVFQPDHGGLIWTDNAAVFVSLTEGVEGRAQRSDCFPEDVSTNSGSLSARRIQRDCGRYFYLRQFGNGASMFMLDPAPVVARNILFEAIARENAKVPKLDIEF